MTVWVFDATFYNIFTVLRGEISTCLITYIIVIEIIWNMNWNHISIWNVRYRRGFTWCCWWNDAYFLFSLGIVNLCSFLIIPRKPTIFIESYRCFPCDILWKTKWEEEQDEGKNKFISLKENKQKDEKKKVQAHMSFILMVWNRNDTWGEQWYKLKYWNFINLIF